MNCKYYRIRTKKGVHYKYCILNKEIIQDDCYNLPMKVKKVVWERDGHACIYCGKYVDVYYANSHYIKRSHLGKGIEQNVVCACPTCHYKYDFKDFDGEMKNYTKRYLSRLYDEWNEDDLVYRK